MYGDTRTAIGAIAKPAAASSKKASEAIPRTVSSSLLGLVMLCFICQWWSRKVASSTSANAGIRRQKSPSSRSRCEVAPASAAARTTRGGASCSFTPRTGRSTMPFG